LSSASAARPTVLSVLKHAAVPVAVGAGAAIVAATALSLYRRPAFRAFTASRQVSPSLTKAALAAIARSLARRAIRHLIRAQYKTLKSEW
jgi:hypothetical protein